MAEPPSDAVVAATVPAPPGGAYRVAKAANPLEFPAPPAPLPDEDLDPERTPSSEPVLTGNRFDDAFGERPGLYLATTAEGAFGETLARFRERAAAWALLDSLRGEPDAGEPAIDRGRVPPDWPYSRNVAFSHFERDARFVDIDASDTHLELAREMPDVLRRYGLRDIDRGVVLGPDRRITRKIASYFSHRSNLDRSVAGLRYESRVRGEWECWLIWPPSPLVADSESVLPVTWMNADLRSAAEKLRLELPAA